MTTAEYNKCVDLHSDGVFRFILKNMKDEDKAKDIVQDTFEKLWLKVGEVSFEKSKSYLSSAAYHTMIDVLRRDKFRGEWNEVNINDYRYDDRQYTDVKEYLDKMLDRLPEIQRSVLLLRDYEGYSYKEIGDIVHLNESQVKVYIYRARLLLKEQIGSMKELI